jgi:16S rRNA processing protein RimM
VHQNIVLLALEGIDTRNDAEALRDRFLCIHEEERWALPEDEFYVDDLAGLDVVEADSGSPVGSVTRITDGPVHDYLEVARPGKDKPVLIPFIREFVTRVSIPNRRIEVRLPEGLLDLENLPADD